MSLELSKLKKEIRIYQIVSTSEYVIRTTYRDMNISSYKWVLEVSYSSCPDSVIFQVKNYTRDTLQRRFKEWKDSQGFILELVEVRQYFLPKVISDL